MFATSFHCRYHEYWNVPVRILASRAIFYRNTESLTGRFVAVDPGYIAVK